MSEEMSGQASLSHDERTGISSGISSVWSGFGGID